MHCLCRLLCHSLGRRRHQSTDRQATARALQGRRGRSLPAPRAFRDDDDGGDVGEGGEGLLLAQFRFKVAAMTEVLAKESLRRKQLIWLRKG